MEEQLNYAAWLHFEDTPGVGVTFPDFPGCVTQGDTVEQALAGKDRPGGGKRGHEPFRLYGCGSGGAGGKGKNDMEGQRDRWAGPLWIFSPTGRPLA
jgi:hypothetical protein